MCQLNMVTDGRLRSGGLPHLEIDLSLYGQIWDAGGHSSRRAGFCNQRRPEVADAPARQKVTAPAFLFFSILD